MRGKKMSYCCAGIVLFNPELDRLRENINSIENQVDKIILIDNCSTNVEDVIAEYGGKENFTIIRNNINKGIATALNQICDQALKWEYEWVLLLDQDSICSPTMVDSYKEYIHDDTNALITPYIVDINKMDFEEYLELDLPTITAVDWAITSGSLIKISVWKKIGKFFEDLFIDAVDIDYSMRLKINNYKQVRVNTEYLLQEVGFAEPTWIFRPHKDNAKKWSIKRYYRTNHSLLRQYYMTRNNIILARKYSNYNSLIKRIGFSLLMAFPKPLVEKSKVKLCRTLVKGFYDGFKFNVSKYKRGEL
ncbi:glycosyltransferase family 2 protein [Rossellomorea marisflavi]|uniref:glycosyltransferase family 2 protein n=1 Tax=Rossellomorea marisflavi TaxID=189381 RepID=UPI003F9F1387